MRLRNRAGDPVDPVPFLVVAATTLATAYSFGPIYGLAYGLSLRAALVASTAVFLATTAAAYWRLVWTYGPARREVLSAGTRFRRLLYAAAVLAVAMLALGLPLL